MLDVSTEAKFFHLIPQIANLHALAAMRVNFLLNLNRLKENIEELILLEDIMLPVEVEIEFPENQGQVRLRLWDKASWVVAHKNVYSASEIELAKSQAIFSNENERSLFLQLVNVPEGTWFLDTLQQENYCQIPRLFFSSRSGGHFLTSARRKAVESNDSNVLFFVEPYLFAAAFGQLAFASVTPSGISINELLQLTLDLDHWEIQCLPPYVNAEGQPWIAFKVRGQGKFRYCQATSAMLRAWRLVYKLHAQYYGDFVSIPANGPSAISDPHKSPHGGQTFLLQWAGKRLTRADIEKCLAFLLFGNHYWLHINDFCDITPYFLEHTSPGASSCDVFNEVVKRLDTGMERKSTKFVNWDSYSPLSLDQRNP